MNYTYPQLIEQREYGTVAGGALGATTNAADDAPDGCGSKACYLYVVDVTTGTALELVCADGTSNTFTVVAVGQEIRCDFIGTGAATTVDCIQIGWG